MRKILDKYIKKKQLFAVLVNDSDILFYIDNLFFYHKKHLTLRKKIDIARENFLYNHIDSKIKKDLESLSRKQIDLNRYIRLFFILFIIELVKLFEEDESFKNHINTVIKIQYDTYDRIRRGNTQTLSKVSDIVIHFRDACCHSKAEEISRRPQFKENDISGGKIHLDFTCDSKTNARAFMIGMGFLHFHEIEEIIDEVLKVKFP